MGSVRRLSRKTFLGAAGFGAVALAVGPALSGDVEARAAEVRAGHGSGEDTALRVVSWNIRNGRLGGTDPHFTGGEQNLRQLIQFLRRERPDVLVTVETYGAGDEILAGLNRGVDEDRRYAGVQITVGTKEQEEGPDRDNLWLFTRYPVVERYAPINEDRLSSFNFGGIRIRLPDGKEVSVFSTWLWNAGWAWGTADDTALDLKYGLPRRWTDQEIIQTDLERRQEMASVIVNERLPQYIGDPGAPVIMAGDFNTMSPLDWSAQWAGAPGHEGLVLEWPAMKVFEQAGFVDTYRAANPDAGRYPGRTWSPYFGFGYAPGRIDFILARGADIRITGSHTHTRRLPEHQVVSFDDQFPFYSDHGVVVSDLVVHGGGPSYFGEPPRETEPPFGVEWPEPAGKLVPREEITATATTAHVGFEATKAIDGDVATMWHSEWSPKSSLPQSITLELGKVRRVRTLTYQGRVTSRYNGNVTHWRVLAARDGSSFHQVVEGTWEANSWEKAIDLKGIHASHLRFEVIWGFETTWISGSTDPGLAAATEIRVYEEPAG
ncbi:endonuclease/exonuclease/phosphatase family protein [Actinopolymorpha pittospori]|uniref:F5/8 type C domain-containing protein n=1 Tax=Actinopolymorpha pittospori TaxID=648752 RepID=A0A927N1F8_9ACTN|nr:endonuclease/exonuclease/phosphatase family protein [Actinopolymorpha pittospori]MBE1606940.1 hypothetical protein [Actinopolymorpha pittospori]